MGYGDSANWNGTVPSASEVDWTIEWKTTFQALKGWVRRSLMCSFDVHSNDPPYQVAEIMAEAWNDQHPEGRWAIYESENRNRLCRVTFDGYVYKMEVRGYVKGEDPGNPFQPVYYGESTLVLPPIHQNQTGLAVFRA